MKLAILLLLPIALGDSQAATTPADDLAQVEAEPRPDKRAHAALDNADEALKEARDAYGKGDEKAVSARLDEIGKSVELADSALKMTGKNPSRSPKHFKYAELKTRDLLRKLNGFRDQMSAADREAIDHVIGAVQSVHDALLDGIMGKKK